MANALHIGSTGSSKRVSTTNQSTIRIQKNGNVQIVGMYCTNVVAKTNSAFSCPKTSTIDDVNILWRTQRRLKFESGSKRVNVHLGRLTTFVIQEVLIFLMLEIHNFADFLWQSLLCFFESSGNFQTVRFVFS